MKKETNIPVSVQAGRRCLPVLFALAMVAMSACTEDEAVHPASVTLAVQAVSAGEETGVAASRADTRATTTEPPVGSSIGLFRLTDSHYTTAVNQVKYTRSASGWAVATAGTEIKLGADDCRALLYAYYPNNDKISISGNETVTLGSRMYDSGYDLCYMAAGTAEAADAASGQVYNFHPGVKIPMKRAYTQVAVSLTRGDDYAEPGSITAMSLTLNGGGHYYSSGTQNIRTGAYTAGTANINKIDYTVPADTKLTATDKNILLSYLMPPGKSGTLTNLTLSVTADGRTVTVPVSVAGLDMSAGKRYLVKAKLDYRSLDVQVETTDWDSQPSFDGGEVVFPGPPGIQVPEADINLTGNGCTAQDKTDLAKLRWADGNLSSTGSSDYVWSTSTEYGYYYPWYSTYNYNGYLGSNKIDPCSKLNAATYGLGWRTPNSNELAKLSRCTNKELVTYDGVVGMWFMNKTTGLFLPAAGLRSQEEGSGTTTTGYKMGHYWSIDVHSSNQGKDMEFGSGYAVTTYLDTRCGMSVRCVKGDQQ